MWRATLSRPLPVAALVGLYPTNKLIGHGPIPDRRTVCRLHHAMEPGHRVLPALSQREPKFPPLYLCPGHVTHAFLTRSPLNQNPVTQKLVPFDLHALATPPAFVLSQDQTLQLKTW